MRVMKFFPPNIGALVSCLGENFNPLNASESKWEYLLAVLKDGEKAAAAVEAAAEALLRDAVPAEDGSYFQRGWVQNVTSYVVAFEITSGVIVIVSRDPVNGSISVEIWFGRDSRDLALGIAISRWHCLGKAQRSDDGLICAVVTGVERWEEPQSRRRIPTSVLDS